MTDFIAEPDASDAVTDALARELAASGHVVTVDGADLVVGGDIRRFWAEMAATTMTKLESTAVVAVDLAVIDARTGDTVFSKSYRGDYRRELYGIPEVSVEASYALSMALIQMLRKVLTDPDLGRSFAHAAGNSSSPVVDND